MTRQHSCSIYQRAPVDVGNGGGGGAHPSKSSMWWVGDPVKKLNCLAELSGAPPPPRSATAQIVSTGVRGGSRIFERGGGSRLGLQAKKGGPDGGPILGPMLKSLHRGTKGGVRTPCPPPSGSATGPCASVYVSKGYRLCTSYLHHVNK